MPLLLRTNRDNKRRGTTVCQALRTRNCGLYGGANLDKSTAAHLGQWHIVIVIAASSLMRAACSRAAERTRA